MQMTAMPVRLAGMQDQVAQAVYLARLELMLLVAAANASSAAQEDIQM